MLKPIVSMNQMAMNESIATTCCYKWNGVSITGAATVLHGGDLKVNYEYTWYYPETNNGVEVSSGWLNVGIVPKFALKDIVTGNQYLPYLSGGEWCCDGQELTEFGGIKVTDQFEDTWKLADPTTYYKKVATDYSITHTGATSAHYKWVGGNAWLADHEAVQYSS